MRDNEPLCVSFMNASLEQKKRDRFSLAVLDWDDKMEESRCTNAQIATMRLPAAAIQQLQTPLEPSRPTYISHTGSINTWKYEDQ